MTKKGRILPNTVQTEKIGQQTIREKLHYLKRREGLTASQLSDFSGVPLGTINKLLCGVTKSPSIMTMEKLARLFNVPLCYFTEGEAETSQVMATLAEKYEMITLSERERRLVEQFRRHSEHHKQVIEKIIGTFYQLEGAKDEDTILIPCYVATQAGKRGMLTNSLTIRRIRAVADEIAQRTDFAVQAADPGLEPAYRMGTYLAIKGEPTKHDEIGVFILEGEGFVRRLYDIRGMKKLVTINRSVRNITVHPGDRLENLGTVIGQLTVIR